MLESLFYKTYSEIFFKETNKFYFVVFNQETFEITCIEKKMKQRMKQLQNFIKSSGEKCDINNLVKRRYCQICHTILLKYHIFQINKIFPRITYNLTSGSKIVLETCIKNKFSSHHVVLIYCQRQNFLIQLNVGLSNIWYWYLSFKLCFCQSELAVPNIAS